MPERRSYTCEACGGKFETDWTIAEADAEAEQLFGVKDASAKVGPGDNEMAVVCDVCFERMRLMQGALN